jgi:hypothetical protein
MADRDAGIVLTDAEVSRAFSDPRWAEVYPPVLTVDRAAELAGVPKATVYDWSSRGLLDDCAARVGKYLRIFRDRFVKHIFNGGINGPR